MNKRSFHVSLDDGQLARLAAIADAEQRSLSWVIDCAIRAYLDIREPKEITMNNKRYKVK